MKGVSKSYNKRDKKLKLLGFNSYSEYLKSDLWAAIRAAVFERDCGRCRICQEAASQVHHTNYSMGVLSGWSIDSAVAICRPCHKFIEFDKEGRKLRLSDCKSRCYLLARIKGLKFVHPARCRTRRDAEITERLRSASVRFRGGSNGPPKYDLRCRNSVRGEIHESANEAISVPT